jgi:hypothetical protein
MYMGNDLTKIIKKILLEEVKTEWELQVRDINGPVFYKRKKGDKKWVFISDKEFIDKVHIYKIIKFENEKD